MWNKFQKIEEITEEKAVLIDGIYYNLNYKSCLAEVTNRLGGIWGGSKSYSGSVEIPSTITFGGMEHIVMYIGDNAFNVCTDLTSVTIPNSVKSIGNSAFYYCKKLKSITIPDGVRDIGKSAFNMCGLTSVKFGNSVNSIGDAAFSDCSGLKSVSLPNSVTYIGTSAFSRCTGLESITIPNSVMRIGSYAFSGCWNLASVSIPNSLTMIERNTFENCVSLKSVTIPDGVTSIDNLAFSGCSSLKSVTIPNSVTRMGNLVFTNCNELTSVYSLIVEPFEIYENVFVDDNSNFTSATLYVPKGTKAKYEATPAWNKFQKIEEIQGLKGDVNGDGAVDVADIGAVIDVMAKGIYDSVADVNGDGAVDVADIGTIIDIMAGKDVDTPEEQAYTSCPDSHHPHWIDLGLPSGTKWACCNQGASSPEDYGIHYTFDEAQAYNPPSLDQIEELLNNPTSEWATQNGVYGRKFTGTNGGSLFLPAAGDVWDGQWDGESTWGCYWSSTPYEKYNAYYFSFNSDRVRWSNGYSRHGGLSVRPVR